MSDRKVRVTVATVAGCAREIVNLVTGPDRSRPKRQWCLRIGKRGFVAILAIWESKDIASRLINALLFNSGRGPEPRGTHWLQLITMDDAMD